MLKFLSHVFLAAALATSVATVSACVPPTGTSSEPPTGTASVLPDEKGAQLDDAFWRAYYPEFKKGMTWIYSLKNVDESSEAGELGDLELEWTVLEVKGDEAIIDATTYNDEQVLSEGEVKLSRAPSETQKSTRYTFQGTENLTLHGKTYKNVVKIEVTSTEGDADDDDSEEDKPSFIWLAEGVGMVKVVTEGLIMELKSTSGF